MSWADARAALVAIFDGQTVTATGQDAETLTALEWPPAAQQSQFPLAFVVPPAREVSRGPNAMRRPAFDAVRLRFLLHADNAEFAGQRMEAWVAKAIDLIGDNQTLNGTVAVVNAQRFTEFSTFGMNGAPPYGFDMELGLRLVETETRGA